MPGVRRRRGPDPRLPNDFVWDSESPAVLVAPGSSARWIACNGITLAHALAESRHPALDTMRRPDSAGLQAITNALKAATFDVPVLECVRPGCKYVRLTGNLGKQVTHDSDVDGRDARSLVKSQGRSTACFDDLPAMVRLGLLCAFFCPFSPIDVSMKTLTWRGAGSKLPQPVASRSFAAAVIPVPVHITSVA